MAHVSQETLEERLSEAATLVTVGARYVHYKDSTHTYTVLGFGIREEDETVAVIYRAEYEKRLTFIRPLLSWIQSVSVKGGDIPRFRLVTDTEYN